MKKRLEPFTDPVLGDVVFDPRRAYWRFNLLLRDGKTVPGTITPEDERLPLQGQGLEAMVKRIAWLVEHEEAVRRRIAEKLFPRWQVDWFDPEESDVASVDDFASMISLRAIDILEDGHPGLIYDDGELYHGHAIVVTVGDEGETIYEPRLGG